MLELEAAWDQSAIPNFQKSLVNYPKCKLHRTAGKKDDIRAARRRVWMAGVPNFCSRTNGPSEEKCGSHPNKQAGKQAGAGLAGGQGKFAADSICSLPFSVRTSFLLPSVRSLNHWVRRSSRSKTYV